MKKVLATLTVVTALALTVSAYAFGPGWSGGWGSRGMGPGMTGGYGMMGGPGMMGGYGMGPGMMGWTNNNGYPQRYYGDQARSKDNTNKTNPTPFYRGGYRNFNAPCTR